MYKIHNKIDKKDCNKHIAVMLTNYYNFKWQFKIKNQEPILPLHKSQD